MPLEIRELVIKATINNEPTGQEATSSGEEGGHNEQLINICVEKVLEIISENQER